MSTLNSKSTFDDVAATYPGQIRGRSFLVTGVTNGLGLAFCKALARHGAGTIIGTGRSEERLREASSEIRASGSHTTVKEIVMDLADIDSVKKAAVQVNALNLPIDFLVNNAGIMAIPFKLIHGYESHFVVNHLSHFLFTNLIIGSLAKGGRVLNITSRGHRRSPVRFNDINFQTEEYNKLKGYGQSKSANILFSKVLNTKLAPLRIESFSIHPGAVLHTNLVSHIDQEELAGLISQVELLTLEQGIATHLYGAISSDIKGKGGAYLSPCQIEEPLIPLTDEDADKLWAVSNEILGTAF